MGKLQSSIWSPTEHTEYTEEIRTDRFRVFGVFRGQFPVRFFIRFIRVIRGRTFQMISKYRFSSQSVTASSHWRHSHSRVAEK